MKPLSRTTIVLALLLSVSVAANWILYTRGRTFYLQMSAMHLDPLGLMVGDTSAVPPRGAEAARVVLFGDSRAELWRNHPFPKDHRVINRGVGGQTTIQILERFDREIGPLDPDLIVLEAGVNDLKMITFFPERRDAIIEDCRRNMRELVRRALATGAEVVLVTIFPRGPIPLERIPFWADAADSAVIALNRDLRSITAERLTILDASFLDDEAGYVHPDYADDLLHLTPAGYERLNVGLQEILATKNYRAVTNR